MMKLIKQGKAVVFAVLLFSIVSSCIVYGASAQSTTVSAETSSSQLNVGDTLTVTIKISNAVDVYGLDVTLNWNTAVLEAVSATNHLGVESHSDGVLHESATYPIDVLEDAITDGTYHLLSTSTGSTQSFSGAGTIVTIVFNVIGTGDTGLRLAAELSVRNSAGDVSLAEPSTRVDTINTVIPEFPTVVLVIGITVAATASIVVAVKLHKPRITSLANTPS